MYKGYLTCQLYYDTASLLIIVINMLLTAHTITLFSILQITLSMCEFCALHCAFQSSQEGGNCSIEIKAKFGFHTILQVWCINRTHITYEITIIWLYLVITGIKTYRHRITLSWLEKVIHVIRAKKEVGRYATACAREWNAHRLFRSYYMDIDLSSWLNKCDDSLGNKHFVRKLFFKIYFTRIKFRFFWTTRHIVKKSSLGNAGCFNY